LLASIILYERDSARVGVRRGRRILGDVVKECKLKDALIISLIHILKCVENNMNN
jgi:hypothetical protein